jgi:hypothetical protein
LFLPQSAYLIGEADELMVDHLGRFETLQRDIREVLGKLGIEAKLERQTSSMDEPLEPIASSALEALDSVYAQDFRAFDYRIDEYPHAR